MFKILKSNRKNNYFAVVETYPGVYRYWAEYTDTSFLGHAHVSPTLAGAKKDLAKLTDKLNRAALDAGIAQVEKGRRPTEQDVENLKWVAPVDPS
jgi:ABC-type Zn uptake system ZnuABC Zn-binding protein ZnuA